MQGAGHVMPGGHAMHWSVELGQDPPQVPSACNPHGGGGGGWQMHGASHGGVVHAVHWSVVLGHGPPH